MDGDFCLLSMAERESLPVLGICAGMQTIACFFGGSMLAHVPEAGSSLEHQSATARHGLNKVTVRFKDMLKTSNIEVNSRHHQAVYSPGSLLVEAESPDGFIEAVRHSSLPIVGVQWHPEDIIGEAPMENLFRSFLGGYQG